MELPEIIAAPMAGGPSTPELVNAVHFGFLALGTCSVASAREQLAAVESPFGVNLFYPQDYQPPRAQLEAVAAALDAQVPQVDLTNGFAEKFSLALEARPHVISSTFGCFTPAEIETIHDHSAEAWVTVTNEDDAATAYSRGADAVIVQGPAAGGHRGTWSPEIDPDQRSLTDLLAAIAPIGITMIAAGGVRTRDDADKLLNAGAVSVACGTAFLCADEAGTSPANRALLKSGRPSVSSRAFSGRWARGVETDFTREHPDLPPIYPYLKPMIPDNPYCLVGEYYEGLLEAPAAEIERVVFSM